MKFRHFLSYCTKSHSDSNFSDYLLQTRTLASTRYQRNGNHIEVWCLLVLFYRCNKIIIISIVWINQSRGGRKTCSIFVESVRIIVPSLRTRKENNIANDLSGHLRRSANKKCWTMVRSSSALTKQDVKDLFANECVGQMQLEQNTVKFTVDKYSSLGESSKLIRVLAKSVYKVNILKGILFLCERKLKNSVNVCRGVKEQTLSNSSFRSDAPLGNIKL